MKRLLLFISFVSLISLSSSAQELGIRFGNVTGGNVGIDAVFSAGEFSRIHADVSFGDGLGVDVLWDFVYRPLGGEAFNWYAGVGPSLFLSDPFALGVVGELGLEYKFKSLPITLGVDWRPGLRIVENTDFYADVFGFNVRYRF